MQKKDQIQKPIEAGLFSILGAYRGLIATLVVFTVLGNALNLLMPKIIARAIDNFSGGNFNLTSVSIEFTMVSIGVFVFSYLQNIVQTYASEMVARDLRDKFIAKLSLKEYAYIEEVTPAKLLTNLTSDIDAIKNFVSQAIASLISSVFLILGASVLLLLIDWRLALAVLIIVPIIGVTFFVVLGKVRKLFLKAQEAIDWLNKVINESILGAALIRLLNSQQYEYQKFVDANSEAKGISMSILRLFASIIPVIIFTTNLATLIILTLGGHFVINDSMTLGEFSAFYSYLSILVFPIILIGFMSNVIAQAQASYARIAAVLTSEDQKERGTLTGTISGNVSLQNVTLMFGERAVLKNVSFDVVAGSKTAIIGPTAAGKTQLLYAMCGLVKVSEGTVCYDGNPLGAYKKETLHSQSGIVFQDSIMFNLSLRENIAFNNEVDDEGLEKAIATAELADFIALLPEGLGTLVSERGTSLSGGQKQRVMLARALALDPKILYLDDFTARVDASTEKKILANIEQNYPGLTLVSVTQKIAAIMHYDQVILLVEGEVLGVGTHEELMRTVPEYVQIYDSQQSTENYEVV